MKKSFKQWIGVGTTAIMAVAVLAGCGSTANTAQPSTAPSAGAAATANAKPYAGKTISLVTANHPWADAIKPLLPDFEKETGIKVNVESFFEDQLTQKLTVQFTSGSATPDVFMYRPLQEGSFSTRTVGYNLWTTMLKKRRITISTISPNPPSAPQRSKPS